MAAVLVDVLRDAVLVSAPEPTPLAVALAVLLMVAGLLALIWVFLHLAIWIVS